jgi:hypothetical protein
VAIALNLRNYEVTRLYTEYCNLTGLDSLDVVYREVKGNIWPFVNLYRSIKAAGTNIPHVIRALTIANNDLPAVKNRYESLKREVGKLEGDKRNSAMVFQDLSNQISSMRNTLDSIRLEYQKEKIRLYQLYQQSFKQQALIRQFQNDNEEHLKIRKTGKANLCFSS